MAKLKFIHKVVFLALVPMLLTLGLLYKIMAQKIDAYLDANRTRELTEYAVNASSFVHELQNERGLSAVFISKGDEQIRVRLEEQKQSSDAALHSFQQSLKQSFCRVCHDEVPAEDLTSWQQPLEALDAEHSIEDLGKLESLKPFDEMRFTFG